MEISYGKLYRMNKEIARKMIVKTYLENRNISETARIWGTSRNVVRKWVKRYYEREESIAFKDLSHRPKRLPNKTPDEIEEIVIKLRKETGFGRKRLAFYLYTEKGIKLSPYTIRNILRRAGYKGRRKRRKVFYPAHWVWESREPFSFIQADTKDILDKKTLGTKRWTHICRNHLPRYQWTFCEGISRFRFLAYSRELTLTNGIAFMILVTCWLRKWGITQEIYWQTDWGEEWGGSNPGKLLELENRFYSPMGVKLTRIPKGRKGYNGRVERSHWTDDYEFYIPFILKIRDEKEFLEKAQIWQYIYNVKRPHFGIGMEGKTPLQKLKEYGYNLNEKFAMFPMIILDEISTEIITQWDGNKLLAYDRCLLPVL